MKKRIAAIAGLLAIALAGQSAYAKTLEDVLKEKGVITEEDYKDITKVKPIDYKLGKGFTFTNSDEKFQLTLGGRMQFRYTFTDYDDNTTKSDNSLWDAKRIRLIAQGYAYSKDLTYKLEFDPRAYASDTKKGLVDANIKYKLLDEVQIKLGQYKTPFARQELTSDGALQFVDRSPVVDAFKHSYDIGAMLHGKIADGLAYYYTGVFGGAGQTTGRTTNDNAFFARVALNPLGDMPYDEPDFDKTEKPLLSIGASYFFNTLKKTGGATPSLETTTPNYASSSGWLGKGFNKTVGGLNYFGGNAANTSTKFDIDSFGSDLKFKWMGLSLQGEYLFAQAEANNGRLLRAHGFYAQAGYMIIPKMLEVAFRYSYLDPDRDKLNDLKTEQIGAVSWYLNKHNLKLQADIGNIHTQTSTKPTDDMQYRVQAQIIF